jgi:hypothetical protein
LLEEAPRFLWTVKSLSDDSSPSEDSSTDYNSPDKDISPDDETPSDDSGFADGWTTDTNL